MLLGSLLLTTELIISLRVKEQYLNWDTRLMFGYSVNQSANNKDSMAKVSLSLSYLNLEK
jgi:hypothetical protein